MARLEIVRRDDEFVLVRRHPTLSLLSWLLVMELIVSAINQSWWAVLAWAALIITTTLATRTFPNATHY
jgi:hypothetical protein